MELNSRIYIAGHEGMVGSQLIIELERSKFTNIVTESRKCLDLKNQNSTFSFINKTKPEYIFLIAGKVGGIQANIRFPGEYLYDNLMIAANVIEAARVNNVKKLLFVGSSCIYPRDSVQPMGEECLLSGALEPTNEGYAIGKIAGLKLCEYYRKQYKCDFVTAIPPNLFGPNDNNSLSNSHVISALIQKIYYAKKHNKNAIKLWGTGIARREFLLTEDLVKGLIFIMNNYCGEHHINIGSGTDISIKDLAYLIKDIVGYTGVFEWDNSKPDGMPQKLMDSSVINNLGWKPKYSLRAGLLRTYKWYIGNGSRRTI